MKELTEIVAAWDALCAEGREALLATVVRVSGSTYRRPGARMLLTPEGRLAGSVSGGCLEGDILQKAWWRTQDGPALVTYDSTDADDDVIWGFGLGCNGVVQVLLERVGPDRPGPLRLLSDVLRQRRPGLLATVIGADASTARLGERLLYFPGGVIETDISDTALAAQIRAEASEAGADGASGTQTYPLSAGSADVSWEIVQPPLPLVIFGAGHDALPLARLAKELGWHVTVVDTRSPQARPERFPHADAVLACPPEAAPHAVRLDAHTAAVVMTHNYSDDRRVLEALLTTPVGYIGQLGPRARTERLLAEIGDNGFTVTEAHARRLHGPVGLDLGADNPEEIALSIVAEIQAVHAGRDGSPLRVRRESLHPHLADVIRNRVGETETAACLLSAS